MKCVLTQVHKVKVWPFHLVDKRETRSAGFSSVVRNSSVPTTLNKDHLKVVGSVTKDGGLVMGLHAQAAAWASLHEIAIGISKRLLATEAAGGEMLLSTWWRLDNVFLSLIPPQNLVLDRYLDFGSIYCLLCSVERWYFMNGVPISDVKIVSLCSVSSYFISRITTSVLISLALCKWTRLALFMVPTLFYCHCLSRLEII